jgi:hypothetical protein
MGDLGVVFRAKRPELSRVRKALRGAGLRKLRLHTARDSHKVYISFVGDSDYKMETVREYLEDNLGMEIRAMDRGPNMEVIRAVRGRRPRLS